MAFKIHKRISDVFEKGELIRIDSTGETFIYDSCIGGANFSVCLVVNVGGTLIEWKGLLWVDNVSKVNANGVVIDNFDKHKFFN